jgi:phage shock protein A
MDQSIQSLRNLCHSWKEKAELALEKGREDLAKAALVEKEKVSTMADRLSEEINSLKQTLAAYQADIVKLQQKLREASARRNTIRSRMEVAENTLKMRELTHGEEVEEAFSKFDVLERRVDDAEARADAAAMGDGYTSLEYEIAERKMDEKVEAELAEMKKASGK